jgi:cellulose synthase/poly-beta-1,6-N-acetylglucosamine synthase-like glycosyltransferase
MTFLVLGAAFLVAAAAIVGAYAAWLLTAPRHPSPAPCTALPEVLIVVPVYDEAPLILRKLENLAALDYPPALWCATIVDGGSTDGTIAIAEQWIAERPAFTLLQTTHRDKTAQLNDALRVESGPEWILVTDADAQLAPGTLRALVAVAMADPSVGVVGAGVRPAAAHPLESLHWRATDWLRQRESDRGSAAIVAAPCYLARRQFLAGMPPATLADDVHVACRAMLEGQRVGHASTTVMELRSPRTFHALLRHKHRKADAYLREIVRFLPAARRMPAPLRAIFLWRAALLTVVPFLGAAGAVLLALGTPVLLEHVTPAWLLLAVPFLFAPVRRAACAVVLAAMLAAVSALALFTYPFSRQAASFPKIVQPWEYQFRDEAQ